jgi:hypothetical protein
VVASSLVTDKPPPQVNDVRQIEVVLHRLAVIHPLEARIKAAPNVNHNRL